MVYAAINASYPSASHSYNCHLLRVIGIHINGGKRHAMRIQIPFDDHDETTKEQSCQQKGDKVDRASMG